MLRWKRSTRRVPASQTSNYTGVWGAEQHHGRTRDFPALWGLLLTPLLLISSSYLSFLQPHWPCCLQISAIRLAVFSQVQTCLTPSILQISAQIWLPHRLSSESSIKCLTTLTTPRQSSSLQSALFASLYAWNKYSLLIVFPLKHKLCENSNSFVSFTASFPEIVVYGCKWVNRLGWGQSTWVAFTYHVNMDKSVSSCISVFSFVGKGWYQFYFLLGVVMKINGRRGNYKHLWACIAASNLHKLSKSYISLIKCILVFSFYRLRHWGSEFVTCKIQSNNCVKYW